MSHPKDWSTWHGNEIRWHMFPPHAPLEIEPGTRESHPSLEAPAVLRSNQLSCQGPTKEEFWTAQNIRMAPVEQSLIMMRRTAGLRINSYQFLLVRCMLHSNQVT